MIRSHIMICGGTGYTSSGSKKIQERFHELINSYRLENEVEIVQTGCFGLCALGPVVIVYPDGTFYSQVTTDDVEEIVESHLLKGHIVERLVYADTGKVKPKNPKYVTLKETAFYRAQNRVVLRNCGVIDSENINEYIARDGYQALNKALTQMQPDDVIKCISDSGLRGREGGGFLTGFKWALCAPNKAPRKYVV